jgi:exodeoxyribonuclease X
MLNRICLLDTETTGFEIEEGAALLEVASIDLTRDGDYIQHRQSFVEFEGVIPPEARAIHHIKHEEVRPGAPDCLPRELVIGYYKILEVDEPCYYAAHNAAFDQKFLTEFEGDWICTWRCALHLFPDAPSHKNQVLRYYLGIEPDPHLTEGLAPHRALYDTAVTAGLLKEMLSMKTAEELVELSKTPVLLKKCNFGKHRGDAWADVPRDYMRWMKRQGVQSDNMDVQHTIDFYLG